MHYLIAVKGYTHLTFIFGVVAEQEDYPGIAGYQAHDLKIRIHQGTSCDRNAGSLVSARGVAIEYDSLLHGHQGLLFQPVSRGLDF